MTTTHAPSVVGRPGRSITKLYDDSVRRRQRARYEGLQVQYCDEAARPVCERIKEQVRQLTPGVRVDVPSVRLVALVLGLYRTGAQLLQEPMHVLELSVLEIAVRLGYAKAQVEVALRWLGSEPILRFGQIVAQGLGLIERTKRVALIRIGEQLRAVFRTSLTMLTEAERPPPETKQQRRSCWGARKTNKSAERKPRGEAAPHEASELPPDDPATWTPFRRYYEARVARILLTTQRASADRSTAQLASADINS